MQSGCKKYFYSGREKKNISRYFYSKLNKTKFALTKKQDPQELFTTKMKWNEKICGYVF